MGKEQPYISISHEERQPLPEPDTLMSLADFAASEGVAIYLVGGSVRDLLLGRETEDLDFAVTGDASSFARKFADLANASFVPLDEEHDTARVVFRKGKFKACPYMDFSGIRGADIVEDLGARDFTINSMAIDLRQAANTCEAAVIDPHGGTEDLDNGLIRITSAQSIKADPLRMLRAYRFAATLDFTIDEATVSVIQNSVSLLKSISVERIREELFRTLTADRSVCHVKAMDDVGLLEQIFPEIERMRGMEQNDYHHLDVWGHSMLTLEFLEQNPTPISLERYFAKVEDYLAYESVRGRSTMSILKLAALLHDVGKPAARTMDAGGRIRFLDHNKNGAEVMGDIARRLKLASRETSFLKEIVKYHLYPLNMMVYLRRSRGRKQKTRAMRRFIHRTGPQCLAILLLAFADVRATQGARRRADDEETLAQLMGEIADMYFQEVRSPMPKLVTGSDLIKEFSLAASPEIGKLLQQVKKAQMDGLVKTQDEAMEMVRNILLED